MLKWNNTQQMERRTTMEPGLVKTVFCESAENAGSEINRRECNADGASGDPVLRATEVVQYPCQPCFSICNIQNDCPNQWGMKNHMVVTGWKGRELKM